MKNEIVDRRLSELTKAMQKAGLLGEGAQLARVSVKKQYATLQELTRRLHALSVNLFADGTVLILLRSTTEQPTNIGLISVKGEDWKVQVDPMLPHHCTAELMSLWNGMPARKSVDKGTFTKKNASLALDHLTKSFAALPAS